MDAAETECTFNDGGVTIPASSAFNMTTALSVEAWVKPAVAGLNGGVFEKTIGGTVNTQYLLFVENGAISVPRETGQRRLRQRGRPGARGRRLVARRRNVRRRDAARLRERRARRERGLGDTRHRIRSTRIGRLGSEGGNPSIYPWSGVIDDVAVYSSALSATLVQAHFTNAPTNVTTARVAIDIRPTAPGTAAASAQVSASETDPSLADNTLGISTIVN